MRWWWLLKSRHGGSLPPKSALDLREVKAFAANLTIMERNSPTDMRYRLTGTRFDAAMGRSVVGQNLFDLYPPELTEPQRNILTCVCETPCGAQALRLYSSDGDDPPYFVETTVMPMADKDGQPRFTVGYHEIHRERLTWTQRPDAHSRVSKIVDCALIDIGFGKPECPVDRDHDLYQAFRQLTTGD